jgi:hypothetical protein
MKEENELATLVSFVCMGDTGVGRRIIWVPVGFLSTVPRPCDQGAEEIGELK